MRVITAEAFLQGTNTIKRIVIPKSVEKIEDGAFVLCPNLEHIESHSPHIVVDGDYVINDGKLTYMLGLDEDKTYLEFPQSVETIAGGAFGENIKLREVKSQSKKIKTQGGFIISDQELIYTLAPYRYKEHLTLPNDITSIGAAAFFRCENLTSINIPSSVTSIGDGAFAGCELKTIHNSSPHIQLVDGMLISQEILVCALNHLTEANIPSSVTRIGESAFYKCSGLTTINIPSSVTSIGEKAFYECSSLKSINIPSSVTSIGDGAFEDCESLTAISCEDITPPRILPNTPSYILFGQETGSLGYTGKLIVPRGFKAAYKQTPG